MAPDDERALAFFAQRTAYRAQTGTTTGGTCGVTPPHCPEFSETMPCEHPWGALVWTPNKSGRT